MQNVIDGAGKFVAAGGLSDHQAEVC